MRSSGPEQQPPHMCTCARSHWRRLPTCAHMHVRTHARTQVFSLEGRRTRQTGTNDRPVSVCLWCGHGRAWAAGWTGGPSGGGRPRSKARARPAGHPQPTPRRTPRRRVFAGPCPGPNRSRPSPPARRAGWPSRVHPASRPVARSASRWTLRGARWSVQHQVTSPASISFRVPPHHVAFHGPSSTVAPCRSSSCRRQAAPAAESQRRPPPRVSAGRRV